MLQAFFWTFHDYESEFGGKPRESLKDGHPVYDEIKKLWAKINSDAPPSEEEVTVALDKIDLASVGAGLGAGRVLPVNDIVEEISLIPKIPHAELTALEKEWQAHEADSVI